MLSKQTQEQIRKEAGKRRIAHNDYYDGVVDGYKQGATAWAVWKEKAEGYEKALRIAKSIHDNRRLHELSAVEALVEISMIVEQALEQFKTSP